MSRRMSLSLFRNTDEGVMIDTDQNPATRHYLRDDHVSQPSSPIMRPLAAPVPATAATTTAAAPAAPVAAPQPQQKKRELRLVQAVYSGGAGGATGVVIFADESVR
ncbi:MAG: hypothetical protein OJI70_01130 [Zavarzinia sp.]|nr:hypothetical protein [Zavarzinia sp.]